MKTGMRVLAMVLAGVGMAMTANQALALSSVSALPIVVPGAGADLTAFGVTKADSGLLTVKLTTPNVNAAVAVTSPFGTPPFPTVTPVTAGWQLTFTPTVGFLASASIPTQTTIMDGKLVFYIDFDAPIQLTANLYENGTWFKSGTGNIAAVGEITVTPVTSGPTRAALDATLTSTGNMATPGPTQTSPWSVYTQVAGSQFGTNYYQSYKITIDNKLTASVGSSTGNAWIAKTNLSLILTNDGSNGGGHLVPEPASLGVLALGGLALLARRRRA